MKIKQDSQNQRQTLLKKRFLSREFSVFGAISRLLDLNETTISNELNNIQPILKKTFNLERWPLLLLGLLGLGVGFLWKHLTQQSFLKVSHTSSPTLFSAFRGLQRTSPILVSLLMIWLYLEYQDAAQYLTTKVILYGFALTIIYGLVRGTLFPHIETTQQSKLPLRLMRILSWIFIIATLSTYFFNQESSGRYSDSALLYLIWLASLTVAATSLIILLWIVARYLSSEQRSIPGLYLLPIQIMIGVVVAASLGYRNIASLFFFGTINSLIVLTFAFLILRISNEFFDSLDE